MKIVVFGASGGMGRQVVEQALEAGHTVTAFVRTPSKFGSERPGLTLIQGDVMDAAAVEKAIAGQEAVISVLHPSRPPIPGMLETAASNIVSAMRKHGLRRIVATTGAVVIESEDQPKAGDRLVNAILGLLAKDFVLQSAAYAKVIHASDLEWTLARFPGVTNGAHTGKYRVAYLGKDSGTRISRADGADFVLRELGERKWVRKAPVVGY